ncbi:MAG: magnesium/cobalt transporter CorA [Bacteroidales bacterium]|nr:magnesium/cobalt transporter CorA [Bacteroidales bacterium]
MPRFLIKRTAAKGTSPGSLIFLGTKKMEQTRMRIIHYSKENLIERDILDIDEMDDFLKEDTVSWLNIDGLHDTSLIENVGEKFDIHSLQLEDILNTDQRPKVEEDEDNIIVYLKFLSRNADRRLNAEQVAFVLGQNYLITFQEKTGDYFEHVRDRIRNFKGRIRSLKADYLLYSLMDTIVDNYIADIGELGEQIENLENKVLQQPDQETLTEIYNQKTEISFIRKNIRPVKEILTRLLISQSGLIRKKNLIFLRDLDDLVTQSLEAVELYHSMVTDYLNIYHSSISNRANEVMKVLTIFAAIFIPLTFLAGVYGTNFEYLPELHFKYSYFVMWGIMITVAVIMLLYFKRKKWL